MAYYDSEDMARNIGTLQYGAMANMWRPMVDAEFSTGAAPTSAEQVLGLGPWGRALAEPSSMLVAPSAQTSIFDAERQALGDLNDLRGEVAREAAQFEYSKQLAIAEKELARRAKKAAESTEGKAYVPTSETYTSPWTGQAEQRRAVIANRPASTGAGTDVYGYDTGQPAVPPGTFTPGNRESFIAGMTPVARAWEAKTGIPAEYFLAVNGSESNWGNAPGNMLFGIKNTAGRPSTGPQATWEQGQGNVNASFNAYGSPEEAYADFIKLVSGGRYANAWNQFQQDRNPDTFFQGLNRAGYATDPIWHQKIGSIARSIRPGMAPAQPAVQTGNQDLASKWRTSFDRGQIYTGNFRTGTAHRGIDLVPNQGGIGTTVEAFHPGMVTKIARDTTGAGGLMVWVQDNQGLTHTYMHLAGVAPGLAVGLGVNRGDHIAYMGESGTEGSPHLHYEVRRNLNGDDPNNTIDARTYIMGRR